MSQSWIYKPGLIIYKPFCDVDECLHLEQLAINKIIEGTGRFYRRGHYVPDEVYKDYNSDGFSVLYTNSQRTSCREVLLYFIRNLYTSTLFLNLSFYTYVIELEKHMPDFESFKIVAEFLGFRLKEEGGRTFIISRFLGVHSNLNRDLILASMLLYVAKNREGILDRAKGIIESGEEDHETFLYNMSNEFLDVFKECDFDDDNPAIIMSIASYMLSLYYNKFPECEGPVDFVVNSLNGLALQEYIGDILKDRNLDSYSIPEYKYPGVKNLLEILRSK